MTEPTTDERLRRLEDRAEIIELTYRYAMALDDRDFDAVEEVFAVDAVFETAGGTSHGRDAVVAFYRRRMRDFGATVHTPNGHVLQFIDDSHATGQVLSHAEMAIDGEAYWLAFRYDDEYVREHGRWRFRSRRVRTVYTMPLRELPAGLAEIDRKRWPGAERVAADLPEGVETYRRSVHRAE